MTATTTTYETAAPTTERPKEYLNLEPREWLWPLAALLSLAMVGLSFPLGYIALAIVMINRFFKDRYFFLILFCLWCGNYGFTAVDNYKMQPWNIGFIIAIIGAIALKWAPTTRKTIIALILYACALVGLAMLSDESLGVQLITLKMYLFFIMFTIPLLFFANREFNIAIFFRRLFPFIFIICIFYIIDCAIFSGNVLVPNTRLPGGVLSRFFDLYWQPLSFRFIRKYPPALYWMAIAIFPVMNYYKLKPWQWILIGLALLTCRTFSTISAYVLAFLLFQKNTLKIALSLIAMMIVLVPIYFFDKAMGVTGNEESTLRISSTIDQFINLGEAQDDEDLAEFASGRMAQALPKINLVSEYHRQWIGLGFLHPTLTKNPKYIIFNEYYVDEEQAEEAATAIEVEMIQLYVTVGILGMLAYFLFYGYTCWAIRKYRLAKMYYIVAFCMVWMGIGGFATLSNPHGLIIASLTYGIIILSQKDERNTQYTIDWMEGKNT